jgi:hypothetical protein
MGNEVSGPAKPESNFTEINQIKNLLDTKTETYTNNKDIVTSDAQYTVTNANIPHYNEYMNAKKEYLRKKEMQMQTGGTHCSFKVGDIVRRKSRTDEHEPCELTGKITEVIESHEWPAGSGKKLPTMYVINFPELFKETPNENLKLVFPCCDLELVFDSKHN